MELSNQELRILAQSLSARHHQLVEDVLSENVLHQRDFLTRETNAVEDLWVRVNDERFPRADS